MRIACFILVLVPNSAGRNVACTAWSVLAVAYISAAKLLRVQSMLCSQMQCDNSAMTWSAAVPEAKHGLQATKLLIILVSDVPCAKEGQHAGMHL